MFVRVLMLRGLACWIMYWEHAMCMLLQLAEAKGLAIRGFEGLVDRKLAWLPEHV